MAAREGEPSGQARPKTAQASGRKLRPRNADDAGGEPDSRGPYNVREMLGGRSRYILKGIEHFTVPGVVWRPPAVSAGRGLFVPPCLPMNSLRFKSFAPYLIAVASVAVVAMVLHFFPWLFVRGAFAMLLGCVFISTWFGGWRSGIVAIVLSAFLSAFMMEPAGFSVSDSKDWIRLGIFTLVASMIAGLHASRSAAVESARISEQRLTTALDAARMGAWDKNLKDHSFWWSAGLKEIFGRTPGSFLPTYDDFLGYIHPEDRQFVSNAFTRSAEQGTEFEIEHRIVRPDGGERWIITRGKILYDAFGNPERLLGVAVDVTERRIGEKHAPSAHSEEGTTALPGRL